MTIADKLALLEQTKEAQRVKLGLSKDIPFSEYVNRMGAKADWQPSDIFNKGVIGAWFDPSRVNSMFQDAAGTTPVTKDGDPVGLIVDISGNNKNAKQPTTSKRPIYRTDGNLHWLEFDGVDDWLIIDNYQVDLTTICTSWEYAGGEDRGLVGVRGAYQYAIWSKLGRIRISVAYPGIPSVVAGDIVPVQGQTYLTTLAQTPSELQLRVNGNANVVRQVTGKSFVDMAFLGSGAGGNGGFFFTGKIYGALFVNGRPDSTEQIEAYMANKAGIAL